MGSIQNSSTVYWSLIWHKILKQMLKHLPNGGYKMSKSNIFKKKHIFENILDFGFPFLEFKWTYENGIFVKN